MRWLSLVLLLFLAEPGCAQPALPRITAFAVAPTQEYPSSTGAGYAVTQTTNNCWWFVQDFSYSSSAMSGFRSARQMSPRVS